MAKVIWKDVGNWANSTLYDCGDLANDVPTSTKYYCAVLHTSAAAGTFEDDRAAHPTYWRTGLQVIPAELLDPYRATLTENLPTDATRKRYPFRIPLRQKYGYKVSANQQEQRNRWLAIKAEFKDVTWAVRQRWYAARPPWASLLWYYNYFMMSGLMGNANIEQGGIGVIKSIQHLKHSVPATGGYSFTISTVDPAKVVVMLNGSARRVPKVLRGSGSVATGGSTLNIGDTIDPDKCTVVLFGSNGWIGQAGGTYFWGSTLPYLSTLTATQISIAWSLIPDDAANVGWEITEHVEGAINPILTSLTATQLNIAWAETPDTAAVVDWEITEHNEGSVYPVIVSIAANTVVIDWSEIPDTAADVSIDVIEYI